MFSSTISLKCRHLRDNLKNKNGSLSKAKGHKQNQSNNIREEGTKQTYETIREIELEQSENDKENEEHF